jgi:hypothetical protein
MHVDALRRQQYQNFRHQPNPCTLLCVPRSAAAAVGSAPPPPDLPSPCPLSGTSVLVPMSYQNDVWGKVNNTLGYWGQGANFLWQAERDCHNRAACAGLVFDSASTNTTLHTSMSTPWISYVHCSYVKGENAFWPWWLDVRQRQGGGGEGVCVAWPACGCRVVQVHNPPSSKRSTSSWAATLRHARCWPYTLHDCVHAC